MSEEERWRRIALFLADCHAATAERSLYLKGTPKSERKRLKSISHKTARMIRGLEYDARPSKEDDVVLRLIKTSSIEP